LEGFVENAKDSDMMILYYNVLNNNEWHNMSDTTKIINGKFLFEGNIDELTPAEFVIGYSDVVISTRIYLEPTTMKLQIDKNQPYAYELTGTKIEKENIELRNLLKPDEKIYYEGLLRLNDIFKQMKISRDNNNIHVLDSLMSQFMYVKEHTIATIGKKMSKTYLDFILKHNTYRIVPDLLYLISASMPLDTLKSIYDNLPKQSQRSLIGKFTLKQIEDLESKKEIPKDSLKETLIGNPAPDFTRKDYSGKTIRLSDYKNKNYVLLDFWASWCIPCIAKIPEIKDLYNKYSEKGLTIISISLDEDSDKWLKAINKYQLKAWPQILSVEDKNNVNNVSLMYNVSAIPHFILIDKQGKISASCIDNEELQIAIDAMLK